MFGRLLKHYRQKRSPVQPHEAYELWAPSYDDADNIVFAVEETALFPMVDSFDLTKKTFADIGCGTGRHLQRVLDRRADIVVGIDFSRQMLARAGAKFANSSVCLIESNASNLPLVSSSFDIVLCTLVLGHISELDTAVAEITRILKPGGTVLISDWHPVNYDYDAQRTFKIVCRDGSCATCAVQSFPHLIHDYRTAFQKHGLAIEEFQELYIDERLKPIYEKLGRLDLYRKSRQNPLLFLSRLRKGE